jgi:hypothetical protein
VTVILDPIVPNSLGARLNDDMQVVKLTKDGPAEKAGAKLSRSGGGI